MTRRHELRRTGEFFALFVLCALLARTATATEISARPAGPPASEEKLFFTNDDLPRVLKGVSVVGTLTIESPWADLSNMPELPAPPPRPEPREREDAADERGRDRTRVRWWPAYHLGVRGSACLYGRCPDGRPPLSPRGPWGRRARPPVDERAPSLNAMPPFSQDPQRGALAPPDTSATR